MSKKNILNKKYIFLQTLFYQSIKLPFNKKIKEPPIYNKTIRINRIYLKLGSNIHFQKETFKKDRLSKSLSYSKKNKTLFINEQLLTNNSILTWSYFPNPNFSFLKKKLITLSLINYLPGIDSFNLENSKSFNAWSNFANSEIKLQNIKEEIKLIKRFRPYLKLYSSNRFIPKSQNKIKGFLKFDPLTNKFPYKKSFFCYWLLPFMGFISCFPGVSNKTLFLNSNLFNLKNDSSINLIYEKAFINKFSLPTCENVLSLNYLATNFNKKNYPTFKSFDRKIQEFYNLYNNDLKNKILKDSIIIKEGKISMLLDNLNVKRNSFKQFWFKPSLQLKFQESYLNQLPNIYLQKKFFQSQQRIKKESNLFLSKFSIAKFVCRKGALNPFWSTQRVKKSNEIKLTPTKFNIHKTESNYHKKELNQLKSYYTYPSLSYKESNQQNNFFNFILKSKVLSNSTLAMENLNQLNLAKLNLYTPKGHRRISLKNDKSSQINISNNFKNNIHFPTKLEKNQFSRFNSVDFKVLLFQFHLKSLSNLENKRIQILENQLTKKISISFFLEFENQISSYLENSKKPILEFKNASQLLNSLIGTNDSDFLRKIEIKLDNWMKQIKSIKELESLIEIKKNFILTDKILPLKQSSYLSVFKILPNLPILNLNAGLQNRPKEFFYLSSKDNLTIDTEKNLERKSYSLNGSSLFSKWMKPFLESSLKNEDLLMNLNSETAQCPKAAYKFSYAKFKGNYTKNFLENTIFVLTNKNNLFIPFNAAERDINLAMLNLDENHIKSDNLNQFSQKNNLTNRNVKSSKKNKLINLRNLLKKTHDSRINALNTKRISNFADYELSDSVLSQLNKDSFYYLIFKNFYKEFPKIDQSEKMNQKYLEKRRKVRQMLEMGCLKRGDYKNLLSYPIDILIKKRNTGFLNDTSFLDIKKQQQKINFQIEPIWIVNFKPVSNFSKQKINSSKKIILNNNLTSSISKIQLNLAKLNFYAPKRHEESKLNFLNKNLSNLNFTKNKIFEFYKEDNTNQKDFNNQYDRTPYNFREAKFIRLSRYINSLSSISFKSFHNSKLNIAKFVSGKAGLISKFELVSPSVIDWFDPILLTPIQSPLKEHTNLARLNLNPLFKFSYAKFRQDKLKKNNFIEKDFKNVKLILNKKTIQLENNMSKDNKLKLTNHLISLPSGNLNIAFKNNFFQELTKVKKYFKINNSLKKNENFKKIKNIANKTLFSRKLKSSHINKAKKPEKILRSYLSNKSKLWDFNNGEQYKNRAMLNLEGRKKLKILDQKKKQILLQKQKNWKSEEIFNLKTKMITQSFFGINKKAISQIQKLKKNYPDLDIFSSQWLIQNKTRLLKNEANIFNLSPNLLMKNRFFIHKPNSNLTTRLRKINEGGREILDYQNQEIKSEPFRNSFQNPLSKFYQMNISIKNNLMSSSSIDQNITNTETELINYTSFLERKKYREKSHRKKKQKRETRRRKKRKRWYPRPVWSRSQFYQKFIKLRRLSSINSSFQIESTHSSKSITQNKLLRKKIYRNYNSQTLFDYIIKNQPSLNFSFYSKSKQLNDFKNNYKNPFNKNKIFESNLISEPNKNLYEISRQTLSELRKSFWKSYWLRSNLNPYLKRINFYLTELKKQNTEVKKNSWFHYFLTKKMLALNSVKREMNTAERHKNLAMLNLNEFPQLEKKYFNNTRQLFVKTLENKINNESAFTSEKKELDLTLILGDKWQRATNIRQYNLILHERIQQIILNIRDNLSMNGQPKFRPYKVGNQKIPTPKPIKEFWIKLGKTISLELPITSAIPFSGDISKVRQIWTLNKSNVSTFKAVNKRKNLWITEKIRSKNNSNKTKRGIYKILPWLKPLNNNLNEMPIIQNFKSYPQIHLLNSSLDNVAEQHTNLALLNLKDQKLKMKKNSLSDMNLNPHLNLAKLNLYAAKGHGNLNLEMNNVQNLSSHSSKFSEAKFLCGKSAWNKIYINECLESLKLQNFFKVFQVFSVKDYLINNNIKLHPSNINMNYIYNSFLIQNENQYANSYMRSLQISQYKLRKKENKLSYLGFLTKKTNQLNLSTLRDFKLRISLENKNSNKNLKSQNSDKNKDFAWNLLKKSKLSLTQLNLTYLNKFTTAYNYWWNLFPIKTIPQFYSERKNTQALMFQESSLSMRNPMTSISFLNNENVIIWTSSFLFHFCAFLFLINSSEIRGLIKFQMIFLSICLKIYLDIAIKVNLFFNPLNKVYEKLNDSNRKEKIFPNKKIKLLTNRIKTIFLRDFENLEVSSIKKPLEKKSFRNLKNRTIYLNQLKTKSLLWSQNSSNTNKNISNITLVNYLNSKQTKREIQSRFNPAERDTNLALLNLASYKFSIAKFRTNQKFQSRFAGDKFNFPKFRIKNKLNTYANSNQMITNQIFFIGTSSISRKANFFINHYKLKIYSSLNTNELFKTNLLINGSQIYLSFLTKVMNLKKSFSKNISNSLIRKKNNWIQKIIIKSISQTNSLVIELIGMTISWFYSIGFWSYKNVFKSIDIFQNFLGSIYLFFEKPGELLGEWIAYAFLVDWASDSITTIPEARDLSKMNLISQINRGVRPLIFAYAGIFFLSSSSLNNVCLWIPPGINLSSHSFLISSPFIINSSSLINRRMLHFYETIIEKWCQPDNDLLTRQNKGIIFWDLWSEVLIDVAEDSNINTSELASLTDEQNRLLENLEFSLNKSVPTSFNARKPHINLASLNLIESSNLSIQNFQLKSNLSNFSKSQFESNFLFEGLNSAILFRKPYYLVINKRNFPRNLQNATFRIFNQNLEKISNKIKINSKLRNKPISILSSPKNRLSLEFSPRSKSLVSNPSHKASDKFSQAKFKRNVKNSSFQLNHRNLGQLLNEKNWSVNQFLSYQGKDTELFIQKSPPKSFAHISAIRYSQSAQQPIGTMVCQIFSGIFNQEIAKNILVIGHSNEIGSSATKNETIFIQSIAGETELKIIIDNAQRYSMVHSGVAIGIKLLKDVFEALSLHTPCIFLLEDIHHIGSRRPLLLSDQSLMPGGEFSSISGLDEKNQVIYELSKHLVNHYKKPYKGDFSLLIPTNHFCFNLFLGISSSQIRQNNIGPSLSLSNSESDLSSNSKFERILENKSSSLQIESSHLLAPPATSPFSVLLLKEDKKLKTKQIVKEMPWNGFPTEKLALISKSNYSIRVKIALLADIALSNVAVKLDMITDLLVIIDSVKGNRGFVVFATTHVPYILDPALRRPGRFDETISLPLIPNLFSRWEILKTNLRNLTIPSPYSSVTQGITLDLTKNIIQISDPNKILDSNLGLRKRGTKSNLTQSLLSLNSLKQLSLTYNLDKKQYGKVNANELLQNKMSKVIIDPFQLKNKLFSNSFFSKERNLKLHLKEFNVLNSHEENLNFLQEELKLGFIRESFNYFASSNVSELGLEKINFNKCSDSLFNYSGYGRKETSKIFLNLITRTYFSGSQMISSFSHNNSLFKPKSMVLKQTRLQQNSRNQTNFIIDQPQKLMTTTDSGLMNSNIYLSLYASPETLKLYLTNLIAGKLGELFIFSNSNSSSSKFSLTKFVCSKPALSKNSNLKKIVQNKNSFTNLKSFSTNNTIGTFGFQNLYGLENNINENWTSLLFSIMTKRYLSNKNLIIPKLLSFSNSSSLKNYPLPPTSNILLPLKRYENYRKTFYAQSFENKSQFSGKTLQEILELHQQQRFVKRLYKLPLREFFRSEIINNKLTGFANSFIILSSVEKNINFSTNINWYYKNRILNRHKTYLTNQWWNGQLSEHNIESTFLSDIDWRSTFVESIGDIFIDFPDSEQFYNVQNRRWILTSCKNRLSFEKTNYNDSINHLILECLIKAFSSLDQSREILDFYVFNSLNECILTDLKEVQIISLMKRFLRNL